MIEARVASLPPSLTETLPKKIGKTRLRGAAI
jgi:hypothetical protein